MPVSVTDPALSTIRGLLVFDVRIDDEAINLTDSEIQQVSVSNHEGHHEGAVITTELTKPKISQYVNAPISFTYGTKLNLNTFYGYVMSITPNRKYQVDTTVDIVCIGVTWPMQNGTPKFSRNITATDMFAAMVTGGFRQDISVGYNLGAQVDVHTYQWPALAQSNESDWEFLISLADRIGYTVYNYQGVVRLVRPLRVLTETPVYANFIKGDQILDQSRTLLEWSATTQSLNLRQNVIPSYGFFDGTTVTATQMFDATPSSNTLVLSPYRLWTESPIKDRAMAEPSDAWNNRIEFWNEQASARINGNARIMPGVNISVQVSGTPNGHNEYDGVWMIRGVKHALTHNSFQTQLALARDTTVTTTTVPTNTSTNWFWNASRGAPKVLRDPVTNKWKSSWGSAPEFINTTLVH